MTITGGDGGAGGNATGAFTGGAGEAGGNALVTIAGDITASGGIILNDGEDPTGATAVAGGTAGQAGTAGTATITFDGLTVQTITATITAADDGEGTIILTADNSATADIVTITGQVGTSAKKIGTITSGVGTAQTSSKFNSEVFADIITHGVDANWTGTAAITMDFDESVTFTTLTVTGGSTAGDEDAFVTAAKNLTGTTINLNRGTNAGAVATLTLDGSTPQAVTAEIKGGTDGSGSTVNVMAGTNLVTFSGLVGDAANSINLLNIGDGTAGGTAKFTSTLDVTTITVDGETAASSADFDGNVVGALTIQTGGTSGDLASAMGLGRRPSRVWGERFSMPARGPCCFPTGLWRRRAPSC